MDSLLTSLLAVLLVNLVLSGDNAVVIGLASRGLSRTARRRAILLGGGLAVALRIALTLPAEYLLGVPLLRAAGGLLLLWVAYGLLVGSDEGAGRSDADGIVAAVKMIVIADITMSLDNILAVAAVADRSPHSSLVLFVGLALSIPIVLVGGDVVARLMGRLPILAWVGAAILAFTAGELFFEDEVVRRGVELSRPAEIAIQLALAAGLLALAYARTRRHPPSPRPSPVAGE